MPVSKQRRQLMRVVDANLNRTKEGLRVCEDMCRYVLDAPRLTKEYKILRHNVTAAVEKLNLIKIVGARNIQGDVGRGSTSAEMKRTAMRDIFYANSQRVKESLRVLEEFSKLIDGRIAQVLKQARYQSYALEQKAFKKI